MRRRQQVKSAERSLRQWWP